MSINHKWLKSVSIFILVILKVVMEKLINVIN